MPCKAWPTVPKSLSRKVQESLENMERQMAEKYEHQDSKWRESSQDLAMSQQYLNTTLEERLGQLQILSYKDMGIELDKAEHESTCGSPVT